MAEMQTQVEMGVGPVEADMAVRVQQRRAAPVVTTAADERLQRDGQVKLLLPTDQRDWSLFYVFFFFWVSFWTFKQNMITEVLCSLSKEMLQLLL